MSLIINVFLSSQIIDIGDVKHNRHKLEICAENVSLLPGLLSREIIATP